MFRSRSERVLNAFWKAFDISLKYMSRFLSDVFEYFRKNSECRNKNMYETDLQYYYTKILPVTNEEIYVVFKARLTRCTSHVPN
jgi:hypothetical protein